MHDRPTISAVVLIKNHARHVGPCLSTLTWVDEVVVLDDGSTDGSADLARAFPNVKVMQRALEEDWSGQMNFGIDQARGPWVFQVDVDERVPPALAREVQRLIERPDIHGISLRILGNVFGRLMGHQASSRRAVRVVRKPFGRFEARRVHAQLRVEGSIAAAEELLVHLGPFPTVQDFWTKNAFYARLEAATNLEADRSTRRFSLFAHLTDALIKPGAIFVRKYLCEGGWRQGLFGLHYALMRAVGYYMVAVATWECRCGGEDELRAYCATHGIPYLDFASEATEPRSGGAGRTRRVVGL